MEHSAGPEFWRSGKLGKARNSARLLFGHLREDCDVEITLAQQLENPRRAVVITSGGCSAISLRPFFRERITALDINPTQNYLAELKYQIVRSLPLADVRKYHRSDAWQGFVSVTNLLSTPTRQFWEKHTTLLKRGLYRCGEIDRKLGLLRKLFQLTIHSKSKVRKFFNQDGALARRVSYTQKWNSLRWRLAINTVFNPALLRVFLSLAKVHIPSNLPQIMHSRFEDWLISIPGPVNRSAYELFLGEFLPDWNYAVPYLREGHFAELRRSNTTVFFETADIGDWVSAQEARSLDMISISNVLEQATSEYRQSVFLSATRALAPEGLLVTRSILPVDWALEIEGMEELLQPPIDKSGICNQVRVFRKLAC